MLKTLDEELADMDDEAQVLDSLDHPHDAKLISGLVGRVRRSAAAYLHWLSHEEAKLRSNHADRWLIERFPEWERNGNAKFDDSGKRWYRRLVIPLRAQLSAYEQGKKEGLKDVA